MYTCIHVCMYGCMYTCIMRRHTRTHAPTHPPLTHSRTCAITHTQGRAIPSSRRQTRWHPAHRTRPSTTHARSLFCPLPTALLPKTQPIPPRPRGAAKGGHSRNARGGVQWKRRGMIHMRCRLIPCAEGESGGARVLCVRTLALGEGGGCACVRASVW